VLAVGTFLGLRLTTDPDHLAAVTTLVAGSPGHAARSAGELGLAWGLGRPLWACPWPAGALFKTCAWR
jgi:hypothetical protein